MTRGTGIIEALSGQIAGLALAPLTGLLSAARQSRMFHPSGLLCSGEAVSVSSSGPAGEVAARLAGPVLIRWSSAWWKTGEWIDVLGCALRFSQAPLQTAPKPDDQDLLLATIQRPWTLPFAAWTTDDHDFLANSYFGVSPFEVPPLGRIEWRLSARRAARASGGSRDERLERAIAESNANVLLEWAPYPGPLTRPQPSRFVPLIEIRVTGFIDLDQRALRFDPYRHGRGLEPVGFVHSLRRATYRASQEHRPAGS
jgi:hypothetical protein